MCISYICILSFLRLAAVITDICNWNQLTMLQYTYTLHIKGNFIYFKCKSYNIKKVDDYIVKVSAKNI